MRQMERLMPWIERRTEVNKDGKLADLHGRGTSIITTGEEPYSREQGASELNFSQQYRDSGMVIKEDGVVLDILVHFGCWGLFQDKGGEADRCLSVYRQTDSLLTSLSTSPRLPLRGVLDCALIRVAAWRRVFGRNGNKRNGIWPSADAGTELALGMKK